MKPIIKGAAINGKPIGIDLWIRRCQFVAAPSVNKVVGKQYRWIVPLTTKDNIPNLPEWIYDLYTYKNITEEGFIIKETNNSYDGAIPNETPSATPNAATPSMSSMSDKINIFTILAMILISLLLLVVIILVILMKVAITLFLSKDMKTQVKKLSVNLYNQSIEMFE